MTLAPSLISGLEAVLGERLKQTKAERDQHANSESHFSPAPPDAVAYPQSAKEVAQIVELCSAHGCPVVAWGVGTSLEAQAMATSGGLCVDFREMNKVLQVNPEDMTVTVQPGITREELNHELRATGLFFPVDPGANATLGGMASTRASGTTAVRYGTMRDNVMALEVVLADGRIIHTGSRARKTSAGYDLTALFVGAEGTLGLITEMTLRLHGVPEAVSSAVCAFGGMEDAVNAVIATIQSGIPMARIEFLDTASVRAVNAYSKAGLTEAPHLLLEFHGSPAAVAEQAQVFGEIAADFGSTGFQWSDKPEERKALWDMRHKAYYACLALRPGARAVVTDICVPISALAEAVTQTQADIEASPLQGPILGHVGDGNFHAILLIDPDDSAQMDAAHEITTRLAQRALRLGGTITGEHGIGLGKLEHMRAEHGAGWDVMHALKAALDPKGIMNPGKLVPGPQANQAARR